MWTEDDVTSLVMELTSQSPFMLRDEEYERRRSLCFQQRQVIIPGIKDLNMQFRSPEIEDDGHAFKNRILAAPVKINVAAKTQSDRAQEKAQMVENFCYRLYRRWRDAGIFDGPLFDQATLGIGWLHLALNTAILPSLPEYDDDDPEGYLDKAGEVLEEFASGERPDMFHLEGIQPDTMYWTPGEDALVMAAVVPFSPLARMYAERGQRLELDEEGGITAYALNTGESYTVPTSTWSKQVTLFTVETAEHCYHVVQNGQMEGQVLGTYRNFFGIPGFVKVVGEHTGSPLPLFAYRPLVNGKYQTVPIKNVLTTALMTAGVEGAQQRYSLEWIGEGMEPENQNVDVTVTSDGVVVPPPGYKMVNSGLMVGADLPKALETIEALDKYGYPKALNRPEEVAASSGYDRARQQDAVASLLNPPLEHFAAALSQLFTAVIHAVREIGLPVTVRNVKPVAGEKGFGSVQKDVTLRPEDAIDCDIAVTFNSITVFSRIAMQEEGLKMMQADQMTETQFQDEVAGVDDLEAWRIQRALDKMAKFADDQAIQAAQQLISAIAAGASQMAIQQNNIPVTTPAVQSPVEPMVQTNGQQLRSDRGASVPIGPGQAMPVAPTPPHAAELGQV